MRNSSKSEDEIKSQSGMIQQRKMGVALYTLRLEEEHKLLWELAEGVLKSLSTANAKAKELAETFG